MAACLMQKREFTADRFSRLHPSGSLGKRLLLRVGDVMHTGEAIPIVAPSMYLKEVLVTLTGKGMGAVLVAAENRHLEGIFTDGDLRRCLERHEGILRMQIDHLMTRSPIVTHSDEMAVHALRIMEDRPSQIAVLPVVDADNRIEGILRLHDLVRAGL
jgi:arabinose-5-phosphate isomerase